MVYIFFCSRLDTMFEKRKELLRSLKKKGFEVWLCSMERDETTERKLAAEGIWFYYIPCARNRINPLKDLRYIFGVFRLFSRVKPDSVVTYTIKPNVYVGLVHRFFKDVNFYPVVTGLGFAFQASGAMRSMLRKFTILLHVIAFKSSKKVIVQNAENRRFLEQVGIVPESKTVLIEGDGIVVPEAAKSNFGHPRRFICLARLLGEKGLRELSLAAQSVREIYGDFSIDLYGAEETSPDAIPPEELEDWRKNGALVWRGYCDDIDSLMKSSDIFVLPSYHEGMSTAVCEAISYGLPIVGTDIAGIREMVHGNGILVPVRDSGRLASALLEILSLDDSDLRTMSGRSKEIALSKFDRLKVMKRIEEVVS